LSLGQFGKSFESKELKFRNSFNTLSNNAIFLMLIFQKLIILEEFMNIETLICAEVERLSKKYNKDFLELKDVMEITGLGRDKVREIFNSKDFPSSNYGHKQTVTLMSFVIWQIKNNTKGDIYE